MTVEVKIDVEHVIQVTASPDVAFGLLADVPRSVSHFPDVKQLIDRGDNIFEWVMKKKGPKGFEHGVHYACQYVAEAVTHTVSWHPVDGVGNAVFAGTWKIKASERGTWIDFATQATMFIEAPRLMRAAVAPYADKALRAEIDQYLANLTKTLSA